MLRISEYPKQEFFQVFQVQNIAPFNRFINHRDYNHLKLRIIKELRMKSTNKLIYNSFQQYWNYFIKFKS